MVTERQIVKMVIDINSHVELIKYTAKRLEYGGLSSVYDDYDQRMEKLEENQLCGQIGEYAALTTLYGFEKYVEKTEEKVYRGQGDFGNDVPGAYLPIDIKSSNVNIPNFNNIGELLNRRRLIVSKREFNPNSIYIGCAVPEAPTHDDTSFKVWVIGWCYGKNLNEELFFDRNANKEKRAFRRKYGHLQPMSRVPFEHTSWFDLLEEPALV